MYDTLNSSTRPIWLDSANIPKSPQQTGQLKVDVCIIGGGITGLSLADTLKRAGVHVAVVELGRIGSGETSHTTAHLTEVLDINYRRLISKFGMSSARIATEAARQSIIDIEMNCLRHRIDCDFQRLPGFQFSVHPGDVQVLEAETDAALKLGIKAELLESSPLPFSVARAIKFENQAQFHPLKYLKGLARTIPGYGSHLFEETRMLEVHEGATCRVVTDRGTIICDSVVVSSNVPSLNRFFIHTKIAAYRTYAIAIRKPRRALERGGSHSATTDMHGLFWDIEAPYHYIRACECNGQDYLIIGGEDHKTGAKAHPAEAFEKLAQWTEQKFGPVEIQYRWSGQVIEPVDGLPYIGRNSLSDNVYIATGFSGNGMTNGTIAARLISDMILSEENPLEELFSPGRIKPVASILSFVSENLDFPTHLIGDRLHRAPSEDEAVIRENQGVIVKRGDKKIAAFRDAEGELHLMSPICPHLGCHVNWNDAEKSWDCPCHGSRFDGKGQLLNGPAVNNLSPEKFEDDLPLTSNPIERDETPSPLIQLANGMTGDPIIPPPLPYFTCPIPIKLS